MLKKNFGQGLVEFALVLPLLLLLVLGVLDFGRAFYLGVALENSAREGAYYMVYNSSDGRLNNFALAKQAVLIEAQNSGITILPEDIEISCTVSGTVNNLCPHGSMVIVDVNHEMDLVVLPLFASPLNLHGEARMLIP